MENAHLSTLDDLDASFHTWLELVYHHASHAETEQAPLVRFQQNLPRITVR